MCPNFALVYFQIKNSNKILKSLLFNENVSKLMSELATTRLEGNRHEIHPTPKTNNQTMLLKKQQFRGDIHTFMVDKCASSCIKNFTQLFELRSNPQGERLKD